MKKGSFTCLGSIDMKYAFIFGFALNDYMQIGLPEFLLLGEPIKLSSMF